MKVQNMLSSNGNKVANQFIITENFEVKGRVPFRITRLGTIIADKNIFSIEVFQSYDSTIVKIDHYNSGARQVTLDRNFWDYSATTGKYRNKFLCETKKETQAKIDSGEYILADLNPLSLL